MSLFSDSIGLPRYVSRAKAKHFNINEITSGFDDLMTPARALRNYFQRRADSRANRRALERALAPKVSIYLTCKTPEGHPCVYLVV